MRFFGRGIIALCLCLLAHGQGVRATLVGRVTDESGAVVPRATVTLVNTATNDRRVLTTSEAGEFVMAQLPPGDYTLTTEMAGFNKEVRSGIVLETGQQARRDVVLRVGAVAE